MSITKPKIIFFGTNICSALYFSTRSYFDGINFTWKSINKIIRENSQDNLDFKKILNENKDTYFVCDLLSVILDFSDVIDGKEIKQKITEVSSLEENTKLFAELISNNFPSKNIILIRTKKSKILVDENLVLFPKGLKDEYSELIRKLETIFIEKTKCNIIDLCDKYFADLRSTFGQSMLNYEMDFNFDCARKILKIIELQKDQQIFDSVSFDFLLERYIKYSNSLIPKFALGKLLDLNNVIERFIANLSSSLASRYKKQIFEIYKSSKNSDDFYNMIASIDPLFKNINDWILFFYENGDRPDYIDNLIFKEDAFICNKIINYLNLNSNIFVTKKNAEFISNKVLKNEKIDDFYAPLTFDIWGSCVSREVFTELEKILNCHLSHYFYRNSFYYAFDKKVPFNLSNYGLEFFGNSEWRRNIFKLAITRDYVETVRKSTSDWIIVDFYDAIETVITLNNERFICDADFLNFKICDELKNKFDARVNLFNSSFIDDKKLEDSMEKFCNLLKGRYGKNIAFFNVKFKNLFFSKTAEFKSLGVKQSIIDQKNEVLQKCFELFKKYMNNDFVCLDYCHLYLPDEYFVWGESPVHYESALFKDCAEIIKARVTHGSSEIKMPSDETINSRKKRCFRNGVDFDINCFSKFNI